MANRTYPRQPSSEECSARAKIQDDTGHLVGHACWYPQMGGYVGKAVIVNDDGCVDVYVWHDGAFPFDENDAFTGQCQACAAPRQPAVIHHCDGSQFVRFGEFISKIQDGESDG